MEEEFGKTMEGLKEILAISLVTQEEKAPLRQCYIRWEGGAADLNYGFRQTVAGIVWGSPQFHLYIFSGWFTAAEPGGELSHHRGGVVESVKQVGSGWDSPHVSPLCGRNTSSALRGHWESHNFTVWGDASSLGKRNSGSPGWRGVDAPGCSSILGFNS